MITSLIIMVMIRLVIPGTIHDDIYQKKNRMFSILIITILWNYYCKAPRMLWYTEKGADMKAD